MKKWLLLLVLWTSGVCSAQPGEGWAAELASVDMEAPDLDDSDAEGSAQIPRLATWSADESCVREFGRNYVWVFSEKKTYGDLLAQGRVQGWSDVKLARWEDHWITREVLRTKEGAPWVSRLAGVPAVALHAGWPVGAPWASSTEVVVQVLEGTHAHQLRTVRTVDLYCTFEPKY